VTDTTRYGFADRAVHRLAFATLPAQVALADLEDKLYAEQLAGVEPAAPLFITALPRAGTTLLLELSASVPDHITHTYRDMPFLLCPLLWQRFSKRFQRGDAARERAHGDGMMVSADSPEAFEEVIWKFFWRSHYRKDRIRTWGPIEDEEFRDFLTSHARKIVALRAPESASSPRYVSKNNANIARLEGLAGLFPDADFLVPFRRPLQHAASLLRQHRRFLELHAGDRFARFYMSAIGHHDFGADLKPLDFDDWYANRRTEDDTRLDFWLEYWIAAYRHVLAQAGESVHLVSYDDLSRHPEPTLAAIADVLALGGQDREDFCAQAGRLSPPKPHEIDEGTIDPDILAEARGLHEELRAAALA
jgi:hypothetical protein